MTKKLPESDDELQKPEPEELSRTGERITKLTETLATDKSQRIVAEAQKMLEEHEESLRSSDPDEEDIPVDEEGADAPKSRAALMSATDLEKEEVDEAAGLLTSAVDQMVPSLLLSLGLLDTVMKWLKFVAALMTVAIVILLVIMVNGLRAAGHNKDAAAQVDAANAELRLIKGELVGVQDGMKDQRKAEAKRVIAEAAQPKLVTGEDGEVAILDPKVTPEQVKVAQKKAVEAVDRGEEPPAPPTAKGTKIPIDIETKRKFRKKKRPFPGPPVPPVQGPPPAPPVPPAP